MNKPEHDAPEDIYVAYWEHIGDIAIEICKLGIDSFDDICDSYNLTPVEIQDVREDIPDKLEELNEPR